MERPRRGARGERRALVRLTGRGETDNWVSGGVADDGVGAQHRALRVLVGYRPRSMALQARDARPSAGPVAGPVRSGRQRWSSGVRVFARHQARMPVRDSAAIKAIAMAIGPCWNPLPDSNRPICRTDDPSSSPGESSDDRGLVMRRRRFWRTRRIYTRSVGRSVRHLCSGTSDRAAATTSVAWRARMAIDAGVPPANSQLPMPTAMAPARM